MLAPYVMIWKSFVWLIKPTDSNDLTLHTDI